MKKNILLGATVIAALLLTSKAMAQNYQTIEKNGVKMHVLTSIPVIFEVASVLIEGENEAVLIDAQFSTEDAQSVVEMIKKTGKKLTMIFISYSDPDFYFGLDHIAKEFPDARIYSTAQTAYIINASKEEKMDVWAPQLGENAPEKIIIPNVIGQDHFMLEDKRIDIIQIKNNDQHSCLCLHRARA